MGDQSFGIDPTVLEAVASEILDIHKLGVELGIVIGGGNTAIIKEFTGISDPYEAPENPEMDIDTIGISPDLAAHRILVKLESMGFIK